MGGRARGENKNLYVINKFENGFHYFMFPASYMIFLSNGNFPSLNGRRKQIVEGNVFIGLWYVSYECFLNNLYQFIQTIFIHWVFFQVYFGKLLLFLELEIPKFLTFQTYIGITALFLTYIISTQLFFYSQSRQFSFLTCLFSLTTWTEV